MAGQPISASSCGICFDSLGRFSDDFGRLFMVSSLPHILYLQDMSSVEHYICQMVVGILMRHSDGIRSWRLQFGNHHRQFVSTTAMKEQALGT